jgi:hypothetical protein
LAFVILSGLVRRAVNAGLERGFEPFGEISDELLIEAAAIPWSRFLKKVVQVSPGNL